MSDAKLRVEAPTVTSPSGEKAKVADKQKWETPKLEDVSEQVMAQPYIRFT